MHGKFKILFIVITNPTLLQIQQQYFLNKDTS